MIIRICYVFALVAIGASGETMKTYTDGEWQSDGDSGGPPILLTTGQTHYLPNQSSLATTYTSFQQAPKSIAPLTQHFGYEKKPMELDAIPHEYIRTVLKPYPVYINEKQHSNNIFSEAAPEIWPPNDLYGYSNSIDSGSGSVQTPQIPHMSHMSQMNHVNHVNHVTHLSPVGALPQLSPMHSYSQLSAVKHLEPQLPTVNPTSASFTPQTHASYTPMASYNLPTVATPYEHVQTIISNKPYHTAVKHIEQPSHLNSIVPVHSIPPATAYNPLSSAAAAASYAQMSSVNPYEHFQTIVKPYPIYMQQYFNGIKEEQNSPTYAVEQPPPPPPPQYVPSNFWQPDTFVYNKPTFTYHNSPDPYYPYYHSEQIHSAPPVHNVVKHYIIKEKHPPPRTFSASGANFWSTTTGEGNNNLGNSKNYVKHKNFLIKRKSQIFNQR